MGAIQSLQCPRQVCRNLRAPPHAAQRYSYFNPVPFKKDDRRYDVIAGDRADPPVAPAGRIASQHGHYRNDRPAESGAAGGPAGAGLPDTLRVAPALASAAGPGSRPCSDWVARDIGGTSG